MHTTPQIVLRKIGGRFDACRRSGGAMIRAVSAPSITSVPSLAGLIGQCCALLILPLLLIGGLAVLLAFGPAHAGVALAAMPLVTRRERKDADPALAGISSVKTAIEALGSTFEQFKKANDDRLKAIETKGAADPVLTAQVDKLNTALTTLTEMKAKLEELETKAARPQLVDSKGRPVRPEVAEHKTAFNKFMRKGHDDGLKELEQKALQLAAPADGGYALPEEIDRNILALAVNISALRSLANVVTVGTSDYKKLMNLRGTGSGWVGETAARPATNTPTLSEIVAYMGEIYANPQATQQMLDDVFFDAEQWLAGEVATEFEYQEAIAFITGNGTAKPKGFLAYATAATTDAVRAFGTIQHVATGQAAALRVVSATASPADDLLDMIYAMKEAYRTGATFLMNSLTTAAFRKVKSTVGEYVWQPSLQAGQPDTVHGYPVRTVEGMPDIAANTLPVAFAQWKSAYTIVDRIGTRVLRDPFTNKPYVGFYTTKRVGGMLVNSEAIKVLKIAVA